MNFQKKLINKRARNIDIIITDKDLNKDAFQRHNSVSTKEEE